MNWGKDRRRMLRKENKRLSEPSPKVRGSVPRKICMPSRDEFINNLKKYDERTR